MGSDQMLVYYKISKEGRIYAMEVHSFFFIRTSNFDAEAERSYIFWRFEAETFLKMFLNLPYYYYYLP